jgi:hypothetical protein
MRVRQAADIPRADGHMGSRTGGTAGPLSRPARAGQRAALSVHGDRVGRTAQSTAV